MRHRKRTRVIGPALTLLGLQLVSGSARPDAVHAQHVRAPAPTSGSAICRMTADERPLPDEVRESSGLARSTRSARMFWTHNDRGNEPELFAVDDEGRLQQHVRLNVPAIDWEDIEAGPCGADRCLYVADTGDNDGERTSVTIYRLPEPATGTGEAVGAEELHARFPDGPRDAEALFAVPTGDLYVVTKGRRHGVELYRFAAPQHAGRTGALELVRELFPEPDDNDDRVTAATATPNGRWIGIRTYSTLYIQEAERLLGDGEWAPFTIDLEPIEEAQGEGLAMADDGTVWLSSEAANRRGRPTLNRLSCMLPQE
jgi:hypothetical protein